MSAPPHPARLIRRFSRPRAVGALVLTAALGAGGPAAAQAGTAAGGAAAADSRFRLADGPYPIEVSISFSAALFHWLDSLTGLQAPGVSAGKTVEAHRASYNELFGSPRGLDSELLRRFGEIRRGFAQRKLGEATLHDDAQDGTGALLVAFLEEPDLESALRRARGLLEPREHAELARILAHFAPKYERIWEGGGIPRRFVERLRGQARLEELTALLVRIAEFFRVDPASGAPPHLILVPVRGGHGTHAQANGRHLLIELRPDDGLDSTASVIVHENVHLLMHRIDGERMRRLEQRIRELDAEEAGRALREALPTALGQGVADRRFRREWNRDRPWYHIPRIDRYAKRIFPLVERAIAGDGRFDEELLEKLLALYPG